MLVDQPADVADIVPFGFKLIPTHRPEDLHENIRSSLARDLPGVKFASPAHGEILSIAGGGPSLADTCSELTGYVAAINGSLAYLLSRGIVPQMCGICDPSPHMRDIIEADPRVTYFVASVVDPSVYDKLVNAGCRIYRWNLSSIPGGEKLLGEIEPDYFLIGGGSTMGLRWIPLGYTLGFRKFHLHGLDSSFRIDPDLGRASHAYADHQDEKDWINFEGYQTRPNFIGQVVDFIGWMERLKHPDVEPVEVNVLGDGLLQSKWKQWKERNPTAHDGSPKPALITDNFVWPVNDRDGAPSILSDAGHIADFMHHIHERRIAVQAGGNVGVYPAHLAQYFNAVHTFEPDPANYACLAKNIGENDGRIAAHNAALGAVSGTVSTEMFGDHNVGAVRVVEGGGDVEMRRIDDLYLPACDLIWLDIEGYELNALKGAASTIARFRPAVIIEENRLPEMHGLPVTGARDWLMSHGYEERARYGNDHLFKPVPQPSELTIVAVQVGNYCDRGTEYVAKLFNSIKRQLPDEIKPHFVCITDDPTTVPDWAEALPAEPGLKGWWNKLAMFKPGAFEPGTRILYFDLDTVIVGSLADFAQYGGKFAIMQEIYRPGGMQSAIMGWEAGTCDHVWTTWEKAGKPSFHKGGDQAWMEIMVPDADLWQVMYPGQIVSFKRDCLRAGGVPHGANVIAYHGHPRPHEATEPWARELWAAA